ncbi:MAG: LuxR C-terminal-related transcriptional regulator [Dermatophilaceae bacterium]
MAQFVRASPPSNDASAELAGLTEREVEVLLEGAGGKRNLEISEHLNMSYATAKTHVSRLLTKLDARDHAQLVVGPTSRPGPPGRVSGLRFVFWCAKGCTWFAATGYLLVSSRTASTSRHRRTCSSTT